MKVYKSVNNSNVEYIPISVSSKDSDIGVKLVLKKILSTKKKFNVLCLFSISYIKKIKQTLVYWKPKEGTYSKKWLLLRKNYNNLKESLPKVSIKYKVKSKKFSELLNKIQSDEKSSKSES